MIEVYVPFAGKMTRDEALALAIDLDLAAVKQDVIDLEAAAIAARRPDALVLAEIGFS